MTETHLTGKREARAKLLADARLILDTSESEEKRALTSEETAKYDTMFSDAQKLGDNIKTWERQLDAEREMATSRGRQSDPGDPNQNKLTLKEIELLVDWLRGTWYEPAE